MSEQNNIFENDLLMRAILEGGQEEVPARVWDAVSERLDEAAGKKGRKTVSLWWRRAGVAVAAVAAVVTAVVMVERGDDAVEMVPRAVQGDMIAVVEPETIVVDEAELLAYAPVSDIRKTEYVEQSTVQSPDEPSESPVITTENQSEDTTDRNTEDTTDRYTEATTKSSTDEVWQTQEDWEEETLVRQIKTSFVVSGLTGASGSQASTGGGPLKAPSVVLAPAETGIKERENQTKYGIPVSVGAGVRLEFTPRWSLGVGLNYTLLSRTLQGTYTHVNEAGSIDNLVTSEIKNQQHYLGVPVNVYFNILNNDQVNFYTYAGGTVEKCISDKYHVLANNIMHKEAVKGVQLSAAVGLGAEFMLTRYAGLYIDPSLRYYFDCDQPNSIRTAQPLTFGLELGLRFRL